MVFIILQGCFPCSNVSIIREYECTNGTYGSYYGYNNNHLKVSKSLYIVTILGQLPFMLFTQIAQTWVVQRDSVNTAIIHSYSTLPHNGRIHGLSKKCRYKQT